MNFHVGTAFVLLFFIVNISKNASLAADVDTKGSETGDKKTGHDLSKTKQVDIKKVLDAVLAASANDSKVNKTTTTAATKVTPSDKTPEDLPKFGDAEEEHKNSLTIFFILLVVAICIMMTHLLIQTKFHYLPESIAVVLVGALIGLVLKIFKFGNWSKEEAFNPTVFFIVLLPPIIFESGYNLHKGNFFQNIGTILVFAILGTVISAMVVGGGIYLLGQADVAYKFSVVESFAFGSLISAVDPVATLAIFHSLDVDEVLYMLVFGESILNDAVAITLTICNVIRSLSFISNAEVRAAVGINKNNTYLFASTDILTTGPVQTYDEAEHRAGKKAENETEREAHHAPDEEYTSMGDDNYMEMLEEDGSGDDEEEYDGKRKRNTVLELEGDSMANVTGSAAFFKALLRFLIMFFGSSLIGMVSGLVSAMLLKFVDLRKTPSLEIGMMLVFSYLPYGLAEGLHLSGIMAILMSGIVMSHYTHNNLSPVTQITVQHTFRTIAFIAETCMFAYLGMAIFSFKLVVKPALVIWAIIVGQPNKENHENQYLTKMNETTVSYIKDMNKTCVFAYIGMAFFSFNFVLEPAFTLWSIALILIGRAVNIFPLSFISNYFREHKITKKQQFIMWFSGLRGAIAFALSLHLEFDSPEKRYVIVTTTLIIVLFTILFLGGATMPIMKLLNAEKKKKKKKSEREISLSKTKEMGDTVDSEHLSEITESENEVSFARPSLKGFAKIDATYLKPFLTRRFTQQEVRDARTQMTNLTKKWYDDVRAAPSDSEEDLDGEEETLFINSRNHDHHQSEPLIH